MVVASYANKARERAPGNQEMSSGYGTAASMMGSGGGWGQAAFRG